MLRLNQTARLVNSRYQSNSNQPVLPPAVLALPQFPKVQEYLQAWEKPWRPNGQWWERMGYVVFLHPALDPNWDPMFQGWVKVTEQRAKEVLDSQPQ